MRRTLTALVTLAVLAVGAGDASAHTLSASVAKRAAVKKAAVVAKDVGASSSRVGTCRRATSHKVACDARLNYSSGRSYCTLKIEVRFKSRTSTRLVTRAFDTLCF